MVKLHQSTIAILAVSVAAVWIGIQFVYVPQITETRALRESLEKNRERNMRIQELAKNVNFFSDLLARVDRYHREVKSLLPKSIKRSGLLREISALAQKNSVSVLSIKPLDAAPHSAEEQAVALPPTENAEQFIRADIQIIVECNYENLGRYIEAVENNNLTVMAIKELRIELNEAKDPAHLRVTMTIETFYKDKVD